MGQPLWYVAQGETSQVCLLRRAIYGLKQSPHSWFVKFSGLLMAYGFNLCESDPTVMWKTTLVGYVIDIMWPISQSHFHVSCLC